MAVRGSKYATTDSKCVFCDDKSFSMEEHTLFISIVALCELETLVGVG